LITITRLLARQLREVFRRALKTPSKGFAPAITFRTGPEGLRVGARSGSLALEYHAPGDDPPEEISVPWESLADCEARRQDPVQLEAVGDGYVVARWREGDIPQMVRYDPVDPKDAAAVPAGASPLAENPARLLAALRDALETTAPVGIRYATNHVQIRGQSGTLVATDGRQLFIQGGFEFPWDEAVLIPRTRVFRCGELDTDQPVAIGRTEAWVTAKTGPWTIHLAINHEGRFPQVDELLPDPRNAAAGFRLSPADARFLVDNLARLPGNTARGAPVTLDVNDHVTVRARTGDQAPVTELILSGSKASGTPVRIHTDRRFLARAVRLGFREFCLFGPRLPVLCRDDHRRYVWALLDPDSAIAPAEETVRITSPEAQEDSVNHSVKSRRRKRSMPHCPPTAENGPSTNRRGRIASAEKADPKGVTALVDEAEAVRASLRDALAKTGRLVALLKQHKRQFRTIESTLAALRRLEAIEV